jgi:hypothetical protein
MVIYLFCGKSKVTKKGLIPANGTSPNYMTILFFIGQQ